MRVVLDTNVVLSGVFWNGPPRRILEAAADGRLHALTSTRLLRELGEVGHGSFGLPPEECEELVSFLLSIAEVVDVEHRVEIEVRDPGDEMVLACALGARADAIVTGDRDLLEIEAEGPPLILAPRALLALLERRQEPQPPA